MCPKSQKEASKEPQYIYSDMLSIYIEVYSLYISRLSLYIYKEGVVHRNSYCLDDVAGVLIQVIEAFYFS